MTTVTVSADFGDNAYGNYLFVASGTLLDDNDEPIITPVISGSLDDTGSLSVALLASDDYSVGQLTWNCHLDVQGFPDVHVVGFPVNHADGAEQELFTILKATGWTP